MGESGTGTQLCGRKMAQVLGSAPWINGKVLPMTPRQIELIEASFAHVVADADQAANLFYHRLFTIAPDVKPLLKTPVEERGH